MQKTGSRILFRVTVIVLLGAFALAGAVIYADSGYAMTKTEINPLVGRAYKFHDANLDITTDDGFQALSDRALKISLTKSGKLTVKGLNGPFTVKSSDSKLTITQLQSAGLNAEAVFEVRGVSEGSGELTIADARGHQVKLQITVARTMEPDPWMRPSK